MFSNRLTVQQLKYMRHIFFYHMQFVKHIILNKKNIVISILTIQYKKEHCNKYYNVTGKYCKIFIGNTHVQ